MEDHVLELKEITKTFPGVKALDRMQFQLRRGSIHALIGENDRIDRIVSGIIGFIFESASLNPYRLKFQIMLLNDFSTEIDPAIREQIRQIGETLIRKGHENGSVRKNVSIEDFYIALVGIPMQYLAARYKFGFGANDWDIAAEIEKITRISMCAIK